MKAQSPFKFLDSYTKEDRDIFFGREKETAEIYSRVFHSRILIVYGPSGSGKSSVIQCGLANRFQDSDWAPINIRRGNDINQSLLSQINKLAFSRSSKDDKTFEQQLLNDLQSVYLDYFKPIYLIFDQFEELFIFGEKEEWDKFVSGIKAVTDSDLPVKTIFVLRGEYLQYLSEFENILPEFLENRFRIEKMTRHSAKLCITGPCAKSGIIVEDNFPETLLARLSSEKADVELTFLQVFLDKIYRTALDGGNGEVVFRNSLLSSIGNVGDVLSEFLDEQLDQLPDKEKTLALLKAFVSLDGTKKQVTAAEALAFTRVLDYAIDPDDFDAVIQELVNRRILQDKDEVGKYELRHDSLALRVYNKITQYERDLIEVQDFLNYAFNEHSRRGFLLNESDLNYITPFQTKINLSEDVIFFINKSKKVISKSKRGRRQLYLGLAVIALFLVISLGFLNYSLIQKARADSQKEEADRLRKLADEQAGNAIRESKESKKQRIIAEEQRLLATQNSNEAIKQKVNAENLRQQALNQKQLAEEAKVKAEKARLNAENNEAESVRQSQLAENERRRADTLRDLSLAQSLAIKSLQIGDARVKSLLALLAFQYNKEYRGYEYQTDIYNGLFWARRAADGPGFNNQKIHTGPIRAMAAGTSAIYSAGGDGRIIKITRDSSGVIHTSVLVSGVAVINSILLDEQHGLVVTGGDEGYLNFYSARDGRLIKSLFQHQSGILSLVLNADHTEVYSSGQDGKIASTKLAGYETRVVWKGSANANALNVDRLNNLYAGLSDGRILKIGPYGIQKPKEIAKIPKQSITQLVISNSGLSVAIGTETGMIAVLSINADSTTPGYTVTGYKAAVTSLHFSADDRFLLSSGMDGEGQIFNTVRNLERPIVLSDHDSWVLTSTFFDQDRLVVTGDASGTLRFFPMNMEYFIGDICKRFSPGFSQAEWWRYIGAEIPYRNTCD